MAKLSDTIANYLDLRRKIQGKQFWTILLGIVLGTKWVSVSYINNTPSPDSGALKTQLCQIFTFIKKIHFQKPHS
jgi:hypothetical protein